MSGINKVILVGRLGKNPEIRTLENGVKRAAFTMATSEIRRDKDGNRTELTEWHNIICWRNLAEVAEKYLNKGKQIYLEGRIRTRSWEDNGQKRYITEIEANTIEMLGAKNEGDNQTVNPVTNHTDASSQNTITEPTFPPEETSDDLPF